MSKLQPLRPAMPQREAQPEISQNQGSISFVSAPVLKTRRLPLYILLLCAAIICSLLLAPSASAQQRRPAVLTAEDNGGRVDILNEFGFVVRSFFTRFDRNDGFAAGDLDGDGLDEILVAEDDVRLVDIHNQFGLLLRTVSIPTFDRNDGFAAGDLDGDGVDEILTAEDNGGRVDVFKQVGTQFQRFRSFDTRFDRNDGFAAGDLDGDGLDEILVAEDDVRLVDIHNQFGLLLRTVSIAQFDVNDGFAAGDFTGDGVDEILVAEDDNRIVYVYDPFGMELRSFPSETFDENDGFAVSPNFILDITQPSCELVRIDVHPNPAFRTIIIAVQDIETGISQIELVHSTTNVRLFPPEFDIGTTGRLIVRADNLGIREIVDGDTLFGGHAVLALEVTDVAGNSTTCDPVLSTLTAEVPETFQLDQNYPNPFNPTTTIRFGLTEQTHVLLEIYDVLGRKVTTLVNEELAPGTYAAEWDGKNGAGSTVAGGNYIYRIQAGSFTETKVMTLLK